jgi:hypothetical protein
MNAPDDEDTLLHGFPVVGTTGRQSYLTLFQESAVAYKKLMVRCKAAEKVVAVGSSDIPDIPKNGTPAEMVLLQNAIERTKQHSAAHLKFNLVNLILEFSANIDRRKAAELAQAPRNHPIFQMNSK